jgi:2'-5' RNA ligase
VPDVAWVPPDNLHVTVKFLGGVAPDRLEAVAEALGRVARAAAPFAVVVQGLGAFPTPARARVIWAGITTGAAELAALAAHVEDVLAPLGFDRERRPFSAHVTLGRVRAPRRDPGLARALEGTAGVQFGRFAVERLWLMQSDLSPRGAHYTPLGSWPLGPAPGS